MTRPPDRAPRGARGGAYARKHTPLGLLVGADDGLYECIPGGRVERTIDGPRITSIDTRNDLALAGGRDGAWLHNGLRWRQVSSDPTTAVYVARDALYLGSASGDLLRSTDEGDTWTPIPGTTGLTLAPGLGRPAGGLAVTGVLEVKAPSGRTMPESSGLVVSFEAAGVWFTPNSGATWLPRSDDIDAHVHRLYGHGDITDRLFVTTSTGLYRSTDEGHTWLRSLKDLDRSWGGSLAVLPGPTDALVLSLARSGVDGVGVEGTLHRSMNAGLTWARVLLDGADEWPRVPAVVRPHDLEDVTFVAAGPRLYASHDRGKAWMPLAEGVPLANVLAASV